MERWQCWEVKAFLPGLVGRRRLFVPCFSRQGSQLTGVPPASRARGPLGSTRFVAGWKCEAGWCRSAGQKWFLRLSGKARGG